MRKFLTAGVAALMAAATLGATSAPAVAAPHGGWHGGSGFHGGGGFRGGGFRGRGGFGWGVGAGLAGFALGSALADPYYYGPGYGYGYYPYGGCARRVWNPYYGRWMIRDYC